MNESPQITPEKPALGQFLRVARTRQKLSIKQVAEQLNLSESIVGALEQDQAIDTLPATYIRGYQRAYVRLLGLDESELLGELVDQDRAQELQQQLHYIDESLVTDSKKSTSGAVIKIAVLGGLIALAVYAWPKLSSLISNTGDINNSQLLDQQINTQVDHSDQEPVLPMVADGADAIEDSVIMQDESQAVEQVDIPITIVQPEPDAPDAETQAQVADESAVQDTATGVDTADSTEQTAIVDIDSQTATRTVVVPIMVNAPEQSNQTPAQSESTEPSAGSDVESRITELLDLGNSQSASQVGDNTQTAGLSVNKQEDEAKITFVSNGESWLEVTDANNKRLYRSLLKLDRITVSGALPLSVTAGNVRVLRLFTGQGGQQKVDIFSDSKRVAKFYVEIDQSGRLNFLPK